MQQKAKVTLLPKNFYLGIFKHVISPYIIWSLIFFLVLYINQGDHYSLIEYLKFLVVGYPYHFIPLLLFFYSISPILVLLVRRCGWFILLIILVYQLSLLGIVFDGSIGFSFPGWLRFIKPPVLGVTLSYWAIYFPLGVYFNSKQNHMIEKLQKYRWFFCNNHNYSFFNRDS